MLEIVAVLVLSAACFWAVASPFVRPPSDETAASEGSNTAVEAAKESKYREIRDAEADYRSGKMSEQEWRSVDEDLRGEAARILEERPVGDIKPQE